MELTIKMASEDEAFSDGNAPTETARILRAAADRIEAGKEYGALMDANGNKVGTFDFDPGEPEAAGGES